ncbi:unannotated protein [freshwater metagenome]|uniref:Unannotated protein n=1 Tax=freshwater metagenome TaxID=449393 RepID=A0A6J6M6T5_9ZZZZ
MTVPALPTSTNAGPVRAPGVIVHASSDSSITVPIATKPLFMSALSREISGRRRMDGESASAARTRARLVTDLEPGIVRLALTGFFPRKGAGQIVPFVGAPSLSNVIV